MRLVSNIQEVEIESLAGVQSVALQPYTADSARPTMCHYRQAIYLRPSKNQFWYCHGLLLVLPWVYFIDFNWQFGKSHKDRQINCSPLLIQGIGFFLKFTNSNSCQ